MLQLLSAANLAVIFFHFFEEFGCLAFRAALASLQTRAQQRHTDRSLSAAEPEVSHARQLGVRSLVLCSTTALPGQHDSRHHANVGSAPPAKRLRTVFSTTTCWRKPVSAGATIQVWRQHCLVMCRLQSRTDATLSKQQRVTGQLDSPMPSSPISLCFARLSWAVSRTRIRRTRSTQRRWRASIGSMVCRREIDLQ